MRINYTLSNFIKLHPWLVIGVATTLLFLPLISLKFWLIDDHEIVMFLTSFRVDGWQGLLDQYLHVPDLGSTARRFRPVYYLLRVFETFIWQNQPLLWMATRSAIAFLFAVSIYRIASIALSNQHSLLIALTTLVAPWVSDTLFRLGPAEAYAILFVSLLTFAMFPKNGSKNWLAISIYVAMLVGIKENFVVLIPISMFAVFSLTRERKFVSAAIASLFVAFSTACILFIAYKLHLSSGVDIYNNPTGVTRLNKALSSLFLSKYGFVSLSMVCVAAYAIYTNSSNVKRSAAVWTFAICTSVLLFNLYFYSGVPSPRARYAFPYWPIVLGMFFWGCIQIGNISNQGSNPKVKDILVWGYLVIMFAMMANQMRHGYNYATATARTDAEITQIVNKSESVNEIVVIASRPSQYEPVFSIARFMAFRQMTKPLFLTIAKLDETESDGFKDKLMQTLRTIESKGGRGYLPIHRHDNNPQHCLEIVFDPSVASVCADRVLVTW